MSVARSSKFICFARYEQINLLLRVTAFGETNPETNPDARSF